MDLRLLIPPNDKRVNVELVFQAAVTDFNVPTSILLLLFKFSINNFDKYGLKQIIFQLTLYRLWSECYYINTKLNSVTLLVYSCHLIYIKD